MMIRRDIRAGLASSVTIVAVATAAPALAAQQKIFDVPTQPAASGVPELARQGDVQILVSAAAVRGKTIRSVRGSMTVEQALRRALSGTGLRVVSTDGRTFTLVPTKAAAVRPTPAPDPAADVPVQMQADDIGEIVVTAQKREQSLQDVPISISVVNGDDLVQSGASQLTDFAGYVPGLNVANLGSPGQSRVTVRGISSLSENATVGVYVDDAPISSSTSYNNAGNLTLDLLPYDVQRIELLRGPQGTLYGASSIGGLLKYVTIAPNLDELTLRAGGEVFSINHASHAGYGGQARVNVPIVSGQMAVTGSISYRSTPGWIDNLATGATDQNGYEQLGGRASLLWQASPDFSVRLSGLWQSIDADNRTLIRELVPGTRPGNGRSNNSTLPETFSSDLQYYSATLDYNFGFASVSSTTAYSKADVVRVQQLDGGALAPIAAPAPVTGLGVVHSFPLEKFTQEVRLTSPGGGTFEWLVGGFYTSEKTRQTQVVRQFVGGVAQPGTLALVQFPTSYKEYAVFANATLSWSEQFDITGGLRWAHNKQNFNQSIEGALFGLATPLVVGGNSHDSVITYSVSPQFNLNQDAMLYARVASGYRAGGPNAFVPVPGFVGASTFDPDTITNYEVGFKGNLADRAVTLDVAAFRMDWRDIQLFSFVPPFFNVLINGASARSQGVEASLAFRPQPGLSLVVNGAYTNAKLTANVAGFGNTGRRGDRLPDVPEWSGSVSADYDFRVSRNAAMQLGAGVRYTGDRLSTVAGDARVREMPAYAVVDARASLTIDERFTLRVYARNLLDEDAPVSRYADPGNGALTAFVPLQPRTIGMAVDVSF